MRQVIQMALYVMVALAVLSSFVMLLRRDEPDIVINADPQLDAAAARVVKQVAEVTESQSLQLKFQPEVDRWKQLRVLCLVVTNKNYLSRVKGVNDTWGKRCDKLVFMSNNGDPIHDILPIYKSRKINENNISALSIMSALDLVRREHGNDYDWFVHVDDLTYVVMENLRYFLYRISHDVPAFILQETLKYPTREYIKAPPGFVLNKFAMKKFGKFSFKSLCRPIGPQVVNAIQRCMRLLKVDMEDEITGVGHSRYYGFDLGWSLRGNSYARWPPQLNMSHPDVEYPIFYNGLQERKFYTLEFLLYKARLWDEKPNNSGEQLENNKY